MKGQLLLPSRIDNDPSKKLSVWQNRRIDKEEKKAHAALRYSLCSARACLSSISTLQEIENILEKGAVLSPEKFTCLNFM